MDPRQDKVLVPSKIASAPPRPCAARSPDHTVKMPMNWNVDLSLSSFSLLLVRSTISQWILCLPIGRSESLRPNANFWNCPMLSGRDQKPSSRSRFFCSFGSLASSSSQHSTAPSLFFGDLRK
jgi:hypothetical protein